LTGKKKKTKKPKLDAPKDGDDAGLILPTKKTKQRPIQLSDTEEEKKVCFD
jgi:hypothetical protein